MLNKYEAMFIVKPDLSDEDKKTLFSQINDTVTKNQGAVDAGSVWAEKRKLQFTIKRFREGMYYLLNFSVSPSAIKELEHAYKLNENILRVLITNVN